MQTSYESKRNGEIDMFQEMMVANGGSGGGIDLFNPDYESNVGVIAANGTATINGLTQMPKIIMCLVAMQGDSSCRLYVTDVTNNVNESYQERTDGQYNSGTITYITNITSSSISFRNNSSNYTVAIYVKVWY